MSIVLKREIISTSLEQTDQLGRTIGSALKGGEVIQLVSDLGGGKTTLTRAIVAGAKSTDTVSSPTFTISKEYTAPRFIIKHFDFYRLADAGVVGMELQEGFTEKDIVTIIEWADIVHDQLPNDTITIQIENMGESKRKFNLTIPKSQEHIAKGIL